jgi:hypothetical protein
LITIDTVVYSEIGRINVSPKVVVHDGGRTEEGDDNDTLTVCAPLQKTKDYNKDSPPAATKLRRRLC